ncbi:MAG: hypothetical protein KDK70_24855, partial [Myxococcales bacterium]|nr:hypothetical protein [Myxococcales bacterium]
IAPLVTEHCASCHTAGGIAPFPMQTFEQTQPLAIVMAAQAEARLMPPWHAVETDECQPLASFKHDARLDPEQIQLLRDWADNGAPEGDPALAAPLPAPPDYDLPDPTTTLSMGGSVTVEAVGNTLDFFHCLSFDPGNTEDVYIDGMQVIPGNHAIAHHVLIYVDVDGASAGWADGISRNCGGGAGVSNVLLVGGWVPGSLPIIAPEGVGVRLPAGARLVFNMHYHAAVTGAEVDDATALALRWDSAQPEYVSEFVLMGAPGSGSMVDPPFVISAGATGHVEAVEWPVPPIGLADVRIWSVLNHMHKVGVDMKTSLIRNTGSEDCLVQTPDWDFDWQRFYEYDAPIEQAPRVFSGDTVRVRCTYDNTLDNPSVVEALAEVGLDQPQDVSLGEGTLDEMCVAGLGVAVRLP